MADELDDDDPLDVRLERIQRRAETFRELLKEGDEVTVALQDGEMVVEESYRSGFERKHPKLFGRLLSIEAQMDAGLFPYFGALMLVTIVIVGLHLTWWDGFVGEALAGQLQSWWFYVLFPLILLYLARCGCALHERLVYRRHRQALLDLIAAEELDRDVLVVTLRGASDVENVLHRLKLDAVPV